MRVQGNDGPPKPLFGLLAPVAELMASLSNPIVSVQEYFVCKYGLLSDGLSSRIV